MKMKITKNIFVLGYEKKSIQNMEFGKRVK